MSAKDYLFPDPTLVRCTTDELLAKIRQWTPAALTMDDGTDPQAGVRSDYAQDLIEQMRDILLERGHAFSEQDVDELDFMDWPLSGVGVETKEQMADRPADPYGEPSEALAAIMAAMRSREQVGLAKYGTTVDRKDVSPLRWLQHLDEELMDALMYTQALRRALQRPAADAFLDYFRDRGEALFADFGMEAVDLFNMARAERQQTAAHVRHVTAGPYSARELAKAVRKESAGGERMTMTQMDVIAELLDQYANGT